MANWWETVTGGAEDFVRRVAGLPTGDNKGDPNKRVPVPLQTAYTGLTYAGRQRIRLEGPDTNIQPWKQGDLFGEDLAEAEAYWAYMQRDSGAGFWNITYGAPDADGYAQRFVQPTIMANTQLEQDAAAKGFSDDQTAWLSARLNSGPDMNTLQTADGEWGGPQPITNGGGGGGGGGGGPKYVGPMREVVEDSVKAMLTALTGSESDANIQKYTDEYLRADKERWNVARSGGTDIDPNQVVMDKIRQQDDYKRIHKLRAEGDSETRWISDRQARLGQLGVGSQDADDRAIALAQAGTNLNDISAGAFQFGKGKKDITLMNRIGKSAERLARMI